MQRPVNSSCSSSNTILILISCMQARKVVSRALAREKQWLRLSLSPAWPPLRNVKVVMRMAGRRAGSEATSPNPRPGQAAQCCTTRSVYSSSSDTSNRQPCRVSVPAPGSSRTCGSGKLRKLG